VFPLAADSYKNIFVDFLKHPELRNRVYKVAELAVE
jgi:hypothetical protein